MNSSEKFEIINDTRIDSEFYIYSDNKKPIFIPLKKENAHTITLNTKEFIIQKEDIWENKGNVNLFLLLLYSLDLIFGNMVDSINLPYYINEKININNFAGGKKEIRLSEIIKVKENSINKWKLLTTVQQLFCCFLLLCIGIALSFLFNGLYQMIFIVLTSLLCIYLYRKLCIQKEKLFVYLKQFLKDNCKTF